MKIIARLKKISIVTIILSFLFGIILICFPGSALKYTSLALGIALVCVGIAGIVYYCFEKVGTLTLVMGIICGVLGIVVIARWREIIALAMFVFAVFLIVSGIFNIITGVKVILSSILFGWVTVALSLITCGFGVFAMFNTTNAANFIVVLIGVAFIIYAVLELISFIQVKKLVKDTKTAIDVANGEVVAEATVVEDED